MLFSPCRRRRSNESLRIYKPHFQIFQFGVKFQEENFSYNIVFNGKPDLRLCHSQKTISLSDKSQNNVYSRDECNLRESKHQGFENAEMARDPERRVARHRVRGSGGAQTEKVLALKASNFI